MNRLLLLRPISRAIRAQGSATCSRNIARALSSTPSRSFGATAPVGKAKKMTDVDDQFFGFEDEGEGEVEVRAPAKNVAPQTPKWEQQQRTQVQFIDPADFAEAEQLEYNPEASTSLANFEANEYFATWFSEQANEALNARSGTQYDYICSVLEAEPIQDFISSLKPTEVDEFERLWGLYEWKKDTDPQSVIPFLTFLLRRGVQLRAPNLDATKAEACIERVEPQAVVQSLKTVQQDQWRIDDASKPPSDIVPYPDLMESDTLLDPRDVTEFPADPDTPFNNRVVVRNHRSVFHEYAESTEDDLLEDDELDTDAQMQENDLTKALAVNGRYYANLHQAILMRRSVVQQTGKGKIRRIAYMVLVGDGNGLVGYGEGKHGNSSAALKAARLAAVRNMDWVERFEKRTIWTEMSTKLGATQVFLRPRPVGFGLRCNPYLHQILRAAGLKDISAKVWGSRNRLNVIKAAFRMLHAGHAPTGMGDGIGGKGKRLSKGAGVKGKDEVERARGRKLISLRK